MTKTRKRPSKAEKAAQRILKDSKLLALKNEQNEQSGDEFKSSQMTPRTNTTAMKPRPHKKRG